MGKLRMLWEGIIQKDAFVKAKMKTRKTKQLV